MDHNIFRGAQPCLSQAQLEAAAQGNPDTAIQIHLSSCARCETEVRLLRAFLQAEPSPEEQATVESIVRRLPALPAPAVSWWQRVLTTPANTRLTAVAFASIAILAVGLTMNRRSNPVVPLSSLEGNGVVRSNGLAGLTPSGDLAELPGRFTWQSDSRSTGYRVVVQLSDGSLLWAGTTSGTGLPVAAEVREALAAGRPLRWRVEVFDASGRTLSESAWLPMSYKP